MRTTARRSEAGAAVQPSHWAAVPCDIVAAILADLDLPSRIAASATCKGWHAVAARPSLWPEVDFSTCRTSSRRRELQRLASLAAWAQAHAGATLTMAISARVPPECQPMAIKLASQAALAAAATLQSLALTANRGFWAGGWLPRLQALRTLALCSKEGALSLHGDLRPLTQLTSLVLEARQAVTLSDQLRLPPGILSVELSCIRDTLPLQLSQLAGLQRLAVRRGVVSEGVLLSEYDCLAHLTALTHLALEQQEEEAWLPPPELLLLTRLRHLSIAGNDCSRWPLHGSDEAFDMMVGRMRRLTSLDISCCGMEGLPAALLNARDRGGAAAALLHSGGGAGGGGAGSWSQIYAAVAGGDEEEQQELEHEGDGEGSTAEADTAEAAAAGVGPRLRRLLAHGNQLEAMHGIGPAAQDLLLFPGSVRQLSIDWQVLQQALPPAAAATAAGAVAAASAAPAALVLLPPACRQLALLGRDGGVASLLSMLPDLVPAQLPELQHLLLESEALDALWQQHRTTSSSRGGSLAGGQNGAGGGGSSSGGSDFRLVGGRWRPTRLPGQPRQQPPEQQEEGLQQQQHDALQQLREAGVEVAEVWDQQQLAVLLDQLLEGQQQRQQQQQLLAPDRCRYH